MEELYKLIAYAVVFVVIIHYYRKKEKIKGLINAILFMGCLLAIFAFIQKMTWNGRLFWFYPINEGLQPFGPYINRNHFACYMEMAIPLGLGLILERFLSLHIPDRAPLRKKLGLAASSNAFPLIMVLSLAVLIMAAGLFFSLSRGAIIGFTGSVVVFMVIIGKRHSLKKKAGIIASAGLLILALLVTTTWSQGCGTI